jgi:hypothetical protein
VSAQAFKRCPRCGQVKSAGEFYRRRRTLLLSPYCQPCTRAAAREACNRRRQDPASAELQRTVDRDRQRRRRALQSRGPKGVG